MQRALKMKCDVGTQVLKRQRDFDDAVGVQVALLIGSDPWGRRFCAAGRRPRGRRMFVARSLFQSTSPLHERCRSKRRKMVRPGPLFNGHEHEPHYYPHSLRSHFFAIGPARRGVGGGASTGVRCRATSVSRSPKYGRRRSTRVRNEPRTRACEVVRTCATRAGTHADQRGRRKR